MNHKKTQEQECTHKVVMQEDDNHEKVEMFKGTKRQCQSFINKEGLITLEIEEISDNNLPIQI